MDREKLEELRTRKVHDCGDIVCCVAEVGPRITTAERDALFAYIDELERELAYWKPLGMTMAVRMGLYTKSEMPAAYPETTISTSNPSDTAPP